MQVKKLLNALLLCATVGSLGAYSPQAAQNDQVIYDDVDNTGLHLKSGDVVLDFGGKFKTEYDRSHYVEMLNNDLPDEYGVFKYRFDFDLDVAYGEDKYDKAVVEFGARLRQKGVAGDPGKTFGTSKSDVSVLDTQFGSHDHQLTMPLPWFKHLWAKVNVGTLINKNSKLDHSIKVGKFDYSLGRGIAYGPFFGMSKSFLGLFTTSNDFAPYSICYEGEILKDKLSFDLYFARLQEKSGNFKQTFANTKTHLIGNKKEGNGGVNKKNDVYAARLKFNYENKKIGSVNTESYIMYNRADDQQVELPNDCKSELFTSGWMFDFNRDNFEVGGEVAFNFGQEELFAIDRNVIKLGGAYGKVFNGFYDNIIVGKEYSHVVYGEDYKHAKAGSIAILAGNTKEIVDKYSGSENGVMKADGSGQDFAPGKPGKIGSFADGSTSYQLFNATNRFRPAYTNKYKGWMAVIDASYKLPKYNAKVSVAAGYASGDGNPHTVEKDKDYKGFIGLHESYAGKRVPSVLMLNSRKTKRPLSNSVGKVVVDNSFTDMFHAGAGFNWTCKGGCKINGNVLGYWKNHDAKKWDPTATSTIKDANGDYLKGDLSKTKDARKYYGTEVNVLFKYDICEGLKLGAQFAIFAPGSYYTDMKGLRMNDKTAAALDAKDRTGYQQTVETFGDDLAFHANVGVEYSF